MTCKPSFEIPAPLNTTFGTAVDRNELKPSGFRKVASTTGLNKDRVNAANAPTIDSVVQYLSNNVDFGDATDQMNDEWDCVDRALWGMAYARQKYPGMAVGMAMGKATVGTIINQDHAVMIIWDKNFNYRYLDPLQPSETKVEWKGPIQGIFAFPFGLDGQKDTVEPLRSITGLERIVDNCYNPWDTKYKIYPIKSVEDYLQYAVYHPKCINLAALNRDYWRGADAALWSYIHVRRHFKGAAMGIALGVVASDPSKTIVINIIWTWNENAKKIEPVYWDPLPQINREIGTNFTPKRIFC